MSEVKKCPKCSGQMEVGILTNAPFWHDGTSRFVLGMGQKIFAFKCKQCGYTELWGDKEGVKP